MAGPVFRIAEGYVEVSTRLDKEKVKAAAREAAAAMDAEMATAATKTGQTVGENIRQKVKEKTDQTGTEAGDSLRKKLGDSVGDGRFASEFKAKIGAALKALPDVKITASTSDADLKVAALRAELASLHDEHVGVTIDEDLAIAQIARIKAELEALGKGSGSARLRIDTSAAAKDLGSFTNMVDRSVEKTAENLSSGLFGKIGNSVSGFVDQAGSKITGFLSSLPGKATGAIGSLFGKIGSAIGTALGTVAKWGAIALGGLEVLPPVLVAIAAGLASIPALAIGAAGAIAALGLGFHGIGAAIGEVFNPQAGGGGAGSQIAQVASAERALTLAQRSAADAQTALNQARAQAVNDLVDLNLQLARAHLDEQGAILQVKQAEIDLANARNTQQDPLAEQRAALALAEANQGLKEAKQHTIELSQTTAAANAAGVEGSANVKSAMEQVQSTQFALLDAENALAQARISGAASGVAAYASLSKNAKAFVDEIRKLKPQLVDLQHYVQDSLFAGLDKKLDVWAHEWMPLLRRDMGQLATDANQFVKRLGDDLSTPQMRAAVDGVFGAMDRVLNRFTTGGALDKLVKGFGDLVTAATPFVEKIGSGIVDELGKLGDWVSDKSKSGALGRFFSDAAHDAKDLWDIGSQVFAIVGDIINIALGKQGGNSNPLDSLLNSLKDLRAYVESPEGKKTISDTLDGFKAIGGAILTVTGWVGSLMNWFDKLGTRIGFGIAKIILWWRGVEDTTHSVLDGIRTAFHDLLNDGRVIWLNLEKVIAEALDGVATAADAAFGWIPGLGGKLDAAKAQMDAWVKGINSDINQIQNEKTITIAIAYDKAKYSGAGPNMNAGHRMGAILDWNGGQAFQSFATGGVFPGVAGGLYRFAEQETRRELLMPQDSPDQRRQQVLASTAAAWAGGAYVPGGATAVAPPQEIHIHNYLDGKEIGQGLVLDERAIAAAAQAGDRGRTYTNVRVRAN